MRPSVALLVARSSRLMLVRRQQHQLQHQHHSVRKQSQRSASSVVLPVEDYHRVADQTMDMLTDRLANLEDTVSLDGFDCEYATGVLTLKLGSHGTYVINKQPPNLQIWLSSPISGPRRFAYDAAAKAWKGTRDQVPLVDLLEAELSDLLSIKVKL